MPAAIVLAGLASLVIGGFSLVSFEGAAHLVGAGLSVLLLNVFIRFAFSGDQESRDAEVAARRFFAEHGHWPDEPPPPPRRPRGAERLQRD
jgi:hypothetical protein